jgi:hypothetical protein
MLDCVERLFKVQLEYDGFPSGVVALVNVLKAPGKAILYGARANETILITMHNSEYH